MSGTAAQQVRGTLELFNSKMIVSIGGWTYPTQSGDNRLVSTNLRCLGQIPDILTPAYGAGQFDLVDF